MIRRGISPIFSSLIILVVTIIGSAAVFYFVDQTLNVSKPVNAIIIENVAISKGTTGLVDFVCTIKNVGKNPVVRLSVQLANEPEFDFPDVSSLRPLHPGHSASIVISVDPTNYLVGNTYTVRVKAITSDGSILAYATTAACKGVGGSQIWTPPPAQSNNMPSQGGSQGDSSSNNGSQPPAQGGSSGEGSSESSQSEPSQGGSGGGQSSRSSTYVLFRDMFDDRSLSGWRLWGDTAGYTIAVVNHGRPAPCLYVGGNGPRGARVGAAKTVSVPEGLENATITFNYNVLALKDGGIFPGNLWLRIDADDEKIFDEKIYEAKSSGSGWRRDEATIKFTGTPRNITVIFYMIDESDKAQEFWLDNIELKVVVSP